MDRSPPWNSEAEQALLGAILANNKAYEKVSEFLLPSHFGDPIHAKIYTACGKLISRGQIANPVTLKNYFENDGELSAIGGTQYLARLAASVVTIANAQNYGQVIEDLYVRRELIGIGEDIVNEAYEAAIDVSAKEQLAGAEKKLFDLASLGAVEGGFESFDAAMYGALKLAEIAYKREGRLAGVSTGLLDLDDMLGGLHSSDLVILAGRPSMGKTALATCIAFNAAKAYREAEGDAGKKVADGAVVAFFSLEMSSEQLATRIIAERSKIGSHRIRTGKLEHDEFGRMVLACQELSSLKLFIDDTPALTVSAVRTRARRLARTHGVGLIVIDYLQLLQPSQGAKSENRVQEISGITRGLKAIAKELNVPVLALSQLNRSVEQREDKRPQLADLRDSGSIEQDADVVMFVFREQYYLERGEPVRHTDETEDRFNQRYDRWKTRLDQVVNTAEVIISKQRHGPVGTVRLHFDGELTRFSNLTKDGLP